MSDEHVSEDQTLDESILHVQNKNKDGTMHYEGTLGSFDYDPKQFELHIVEVPETQDFPAGQYETLRYIGNETNGNKIHIPEGITNTSMMFMNSDITCMPKIPEGVEHADSMFSGCESLKVVNHELPKSLENANFMFFGCKGLEQGPAVIPGTVKNANFMFTNCDSLKNTPKLIMGTQAGEFMFGNCKSLSEPPHIPQSMKEYSGMTYSCSGIDANVDALNEQKMAQKRAKLEAKTTKRSFSEKIGSGFGAIMQCHALRQAGYGFIMAPIMTHMMRKNGSFDKSLSGGLAVSAVRRGGLSGIMLAGLAGKIDKHGEKTRAKSRERLANFDNLNKDLQGVSRADRSRNLKVMKQAGRDVDSKLFSRITQMSATEKLPYQERYGGSYKTCEKVLHKGFLWPNGEMHPNEKHAVSEWYQQEVAACVAYYGEAERGIKAQYQNSPKEYAKAMQGLKEVSAMQLEPLMQSIEKTQKDYQVFNDGDIRNIARMVKDMPSEQSKQVDFGTRMMSRVNIVESMTRQRDEYAQRNAFTNDGVRYQDYNKSGQKSAQNGADLGSQAHTGSHKGADRKSDRGSNVSDRGRRAEAMFGSPSGKNDKQDSTSFSM